MVHRGAARTTLSPPAMTDRIRLTISVTPEVHEVFSRMAAIAGVSLGRAMGDWLENTSDGAQLVALQVADAKELPKRVQKELLARLGVRADAAAGQEATRRFNEAWESLAASQGARSAPGPAAVAPSSNTGLNLPKSRPGRRA